MSMRYDFRIDSQNYNLVDLIKGSQKFGLGDSLRFTWISFKDSFGLASQNERNENQLYSTAKAVIEATDKVFSNRANFTNEKLVGLLNGYLHAETSNPNIQQVCNALRNWQTLQPNHHRAIAPTATERTTLITSRHIQDERNAVSRNNVLAKPCSRHGNGNSCFVNTALQIILHTSPLLALFENELQPKEGENKESSSFKLRLNVQMRGRSLLRQLAEGHDNVGAKGRLRQFIHAINEVLKSENPNAECFNIDRGDDGSVLLQTLEIILRATNHTAVTLVVTKELLQSDKKEKFENHVKKNKFPPVISVMNMGNNKMAPEKVNVEGTTYQLQSVYNSTGHDDSVGHATPSIRTAIGDFIVIDDIAGIRSVTKQQVLDGLGRPLGWKFAYYVKL